MNQKTMEGPHFRKAFMIFLITLIALAGFTTPVLAKNNAVLDRIVEVQTIGDYDQREVQAIKERIWNINANILNALYKNDVKIKLINFPLTDLPEYAYLKGVVPRGWEGTGYTWDDVPGLGGNPIVTRIGYSEPGNMHSAINLELHEIAHAVDLIAYNAISHTEEFSQIHQKELLQFSSSSYFNHPEEYFAETFAYYHLNAETKAHLKSVAPETYQFMSKLHKRVPNNGKKPIPTERSLVASPFFTN